jgi:probable HAF family extracellular repeat protein
MSPAQHLTGVFRLVLAAHFVFVPIAASAQIQGGSEALGAFGASGSIASGVSADGTVVVGAAETDGGSMHAFRWTGGDGMLDLGTLGGSYSYAYGVSGNGAVLVGAATTAGDAATHAFRWTGSGGMVDLGTLGGVHSVAFGVSSNGAVVVGQSNMVGSGDVHPFRWTSGGGMADLGTLGGTFAGARGVSADGAVVVGLSTTVGDGATHPFRWTSSGGLADLGTLGGTFGGAYGVSADGSVVVGTSRTAGDIAAHAFRWTSGGGMVDLGTLGRTDSIANGVSADGKVVVGTAWNSIGDAYSRAFRWNNGTMQSVEDWLRANRVIVPEDVTSSANATNSDGSVVVGVREDGFAFIARVASAGSGLVTLVDVQQSLGAAATGGAMALRTADLSINGAHSRPLARRVETGKNVFWLAGDWGRDDHGARSGNLGLAEVGGGRNLGPVQFNVSLGQTWAKQDLTLNGRAETGGSYLLAEALVPLVGRLWGTFGGYGHWGEANLKRGYLNAGLQDSSRGKPDADTWGVRARLDWDKVWRMAGADFSPYADLSYSRAKLESYTETGGGFPARFAAREDKSTELRLGVNAEWLLRGDARIVSLVEAAHRFEKDGGRTSGEVIGLFGFDLPSRENQRDWMRAGVGVEGSIGGGVGSLMLNATTKGEAPNIWLAANWQKSF